MEGHRTRTEDGLGKSSYVSFLLQSVLSCLLAALCGFVMFLVLCDAQVFVNRGESSRSHPIPLAETNKCCSLCHSSCIQLLIDTADAGAGMEINILFIGKMNV
jgi:hypothetical protein